MGVTLQVYALVDGSTHVVEVPLPTGGGGVTFTVERRGGRVTVALSGDAPGWSLVLVGVEEVEAVRGGRAEPTPRGVRVVADDGAGRLEVTVAAAPPEG